MYVEQLTTIYETPIRLKCKEPTNKSNMKGQYKTKVKSIYKILVIST